MSDDKFFVKFKLNKILKSSGLEVMESLMLSSEYEKIVNWRGETNAATPAPISEETEPKGIFAAVAREFEISMDKFFVSIPFFMRLMPFTIQLQDDRQLRQFVKAHGVSLEKGEFEVYSLSVNYMGEINRRLQRATAIKSGLEDFPNMFFMGLISAYDVFLAKLIRAIFMA